MDSGAQGLEPFSAIFSGFNQGVGWETEQGTTTGVHIGMLMLHLRGLVYRATAIVPSYSFLKILHRKKALWWASVMAQLANLPSASASSQWVSVLVPATPHPIQLPVVAGKVAEDIPRP